MTGSKHNRGLYFSIAALALAALSCSTARSLFQNNGAEDAPAETSGELVEGEESGPAPTEQPSTPSPTAPPTIDPAGGNRRATGQGTVIVDGEEYPFEVYLCGWEETPQSGVGAEGNTYVAEPGEELSKFVVEGAGSQPDGSLLFLTLQVFEVPGVLEEFELSVSKLDESAADGGWEYETGLPIRLEFLAFDGKSATTTEEIPLNPLDSVIESVPVSLDVTCDSYGGTSEQEEVLAAEVLGLPTPSPQENELTLDDESLSLNIQPGSCDVSGPSQASLIGDTILDGQRATVDITQNGSYQAASITVFEAGKIWTATTEKADLFEVIFLERRLVADQPIPLAETVNGDIRELEFDISCP